MLVIIAYAYQIGVAILVYLESTYKETAASSPTFYLHHEMDLEKIWGAGRGFGISVFYPDGKVVVLKEGEGGAGSKYCVKRIALCEGRVCALRVCKNDDV